MFEKIVLRKSRTEPAISPGELAEALLFYQNVHLIIDHSSLHSFIEKLGIENLIQLLHRPNVTAVFCDEALATHTERSGIHDFHTFVAFTITGDPSGNNLQRPEDRVAYALQRKGYSNKNARKLADKFCAKVPVRRLTGNHYVQGGVIAAAKEDLLDAPFVQEALRRVLLSKLPQGYIVGNVSFEVIPNANHFHVLSSFNFDEYNSHQKILNQSHDNLTPAHLVTELLEARADTALAAHYGGDFQSTETSSQVIRLRYSELLRRSGIDNEELGQLKVIVFPEGRSLREAIDSGERSFAEFLELLEKSDRFRTWIRGVHPDGKLINAYFKDVTAEGWINKLPGKTLRYVFGEVAGALLPGAGSAYSAADSLLAEKIFGGWRPSHFVESRIKPFVTSV